MRLAGRRMLLVAVLAMAALAAAGCENPLDPIDKSEKIKGLSYVDFSIAWERWDSDPLYDGLEISMSYYNEFGDALDFHDKPHTVVIEFYTQKPAPGADPTASDPPMTYDELFFSKSLTYSNSSDVIRIPIEAYQALMEKAGLDTSVSPVKAFVMLHVFPPQAEPRSELMIGYSKMEIFKAQENPVEPVQ